MELDISTYDPDLVQPMRDEVTELGFKELLTREDVTDEIEMHGTVLVFVNSVCGCAAGKARPGLKLAMKWAEENNALPDRLLTAFAGMEKEAVNEVRKYFAPNPPSSPQIGLISEGKLAALISRQEIENGDEFVVANKIIKLLQENCRRE
ncbi:MAG: BrxA/BrxB family bacilliredoxin [Candidatus Kapaibacterium sp.]